MDNIVRVQCYEHDKDNTNTSKLLIVSCSTYPYYILTHFAVCPLVMLNVNVKAVVAFADEHFSVLETGKLF